jgi:uncharacterized membrane protein
MTLKTKAGLSIIVATIFHVVGIVGIGYLNNEIILGLTPANLLLLLLFIAINHEAKTKFWVFYVTYILAFSIEAVGVTFGWPFGDYTYGPVLGWKLFETPLIIGVNWIVLLYGANSIANYVGLTAITRALCAAALMVFIDYLIEPVAIQLDFWSWERGTPPLENYLGWFAASFLISLLWQLAKVQLNQLIGAAMYVIQLLFFAALILLL